MRGLHWRLLLLANLVAAVAAAVIWLSVFVAPETMSHPTHPDAGVYRLAVRGNPTAVVLSLLAVALLVGDFLWVLYGRPPKAPTHYVVSESPDGPVRVTRDALETSLRLAGEALDEISRLRVTVEPLSGMKRIVVRAQFQSPDGVSIQDANHRLRRALGVRFADLVRLSEGARLDTEVEFLGFAGKLPRKAPTEEPKPEPEPPAEQFTGPQYPIDDDDDEVRREGGA